MTAYYNEIDPYAAQWLRNLIDEGLIAKGEVDDRSITDVTASDLAGFTQCHFFAGIGVWSYALRLNKWPDNLEVWTGSCPCQPFSIAGTKEGFNDERHLWPVWKKLIKKRKPSIVFGEQVASKDVNPWLDLVSTDLEAMDFAIGACAIPSAGFGAPHIRDRTYFVAHSDNERLERWIREQKRPSKLATWTSSVVSGMAHSDHARLGGHRQHGRMDVAGEGRKNRAEKRHSAKSRLASIMEQSKTIRESSARPTEKAAQENSANPTNGFWKSADWLLCRDGRWRPVEPRTQPLANGVTSSVGRLRAYGNAVNAYAAAGFIKASIDAIRDTSGK